MSKVRIAQIGTSAYSHGLEIFDTLKKADGIFEIAGYVLPENEREKFPDRMGVFDGYPELTLEQVFSDSSIQAVTIETEEIYLTKYALMAAKHNKKIHMEKPGGTDLKEFEELIEYVKKNNIVFQTGYMYRYNPIIKKVIKDAKNGEYGEIVSVEAQMNCRHKDCLREWLSTFKGGMMFFLGCHLIDLIIQIQGMPKNVIALNKCTGMNGINSEDYGMAVLEYDNGNSFAKTCDVEYGGFARRQLVITGTKKTVEIKPLERYSGKDLFTDVTTYDVEDWNDNGATERSELYDRYLDMMTDFAEMVQGKKKNPYSYDYELELYKLILRCCGLSGGGVCLPNDRITLHLLSDSLCCDYEKLGHNPTNSPQMGWGQFIGDYFRDDIIIDNQARAGWSTNGFLLASDQNYNHDMNILNNPENSRWKKTILPTIKSGDYVITSLAINDKYADSFDYYYEDSVNGEYNKDENENYVKVEKGTGKYSFYTWISTPEKYKENLKIFIDDTLRAGATPILLGSTSSCNSSGGYGDISQYIDGMRAVAKEKNITYLDGYGTYKKYIEDNGGYDKVAYMNHFTPENIAEFRKSGITVGTKWNTTTSDKTHYNPNGAKYVAKMIIDLLKESDSNLKNYIR